MKRKYLIALAFISLFFSSVGFAAGTSSQQEVTVHVANFNYTPDTQAVPGSAGVTLAVGNLSFKTGTKLLWFASPQFKNFDKAVKGDLTKLFAAKGFSVRGPFDSYDLMPYPDKKATDLYMAATIELLVGGDQYAYSGQSIYSLKDIKTEVTGKISLELREAVTRELMWAKSIDIKPFEFPCGFKRIIWKDLANIKDVGNEKIKKTIASLELDTDNIDDINDVAKGIEKQYPDLMATISKLIDPEEMRMIKKRCQELKTKK
jgi:hypothetical protein